MDRAPTQLPPSVLAQLGQDMLRLAQQLQTETALSEAGRSRLVELEALGRELQTLVHALGPGVRSEPETLSLLEAVQSTRRLWLTELARRGLQVQVSGQGLSCHVDPAQLQHALDLLFAHALAAGVDLRLSVQADGIGQPEVAVQGAGTGPDPAELHGQLLQWMSRAMPWRLTRVSPAPGGWCLRLTLAAATAAAELVDAQAMVLPRRRWSQLDRILVVDNDERTRAVAAGLLREAGLRGDCVASITQAEAALRDGLPSAVLCGYPLQDPRVDALRTSIERQRPGLRLVEMVNAPHVFAAGSTDGSIPARISRHDLPHTLLASLAD